jgi:3-oxoacyl-[acyl-carrier protein] reductase
MERTAGEIRDVGREAMIFEADVSSFSRAQDVAAQTKQHFGRIDFLLNNAGKAMPKGILDIAEDEFDRTIAINLKSCFNYIHAIAPIMVEQGGGRIASMSSINAQPGGVTAGVSRGPEIAARDIALRRLGKPDDIAQVVVFLATSEPYFITGQTFTVDGFQFNC